MVKGKTRYHAARLVIAALDTEDAEDRAVQEVTRAIGYRGHVGRGGVAVTRRGDTEAWDALVIYSISGV